MNLEKKPLVRAAIGAVLAAAVVGAGIWAANSGAIEPEGTRGVITDEQLSAVYPEIYASYIANSENDYTLTPDYLENDPYLTTIYQGYGFAVDYNEARGHTYCLEDVTSTARPHAKANCLTCKTADFTTLVNEMNESGENAYSLAFDDVIGEMTTNVGCYTCHGNEETEDGKLVVTHDYIVDKLGSTYSFNTLEGTTSGTDTSIPQEILSCGQCHIEYYFTSASESEERAGATTVPYTSVAEMSPTAILEYYNSIGFSDWTDDNEEKFGDLTTGAHLLKAQHPEMETVMGEGNIHFSQGLTCADCHMETVTESNGKTYTSHELVSPLESESILENTCAKCHGSGAIATALVQAVQDEVTAMETEVGNNLADFHTRLAEANHSGEYTEDELDAIREVYRSAQWYFDFDYVENSEGAHNRALAEDCLNKAQELIDQGMAMFH